MDVVRFRSVHAVRALAAPSSLPDRSLFRSYPTTVFMNIPYAAVVVSTNETLKKLFEANGPASSDGAPSMGVYLFCGAVSGACLRGSHTQVQPCCLLRPCIVCCALVCVTCELSFHVPIFRRWWGSLNTMTEVVGHCCGVVDVVPGCHFGHDDVVS